MNWIQRIVIIFALFLMFVSFWEAPKYYMASGTRLKTPANFAMGESYDYSFIGFAWAGIIIGAAGLFFVFQKKDK